MKTDELIAMLARATGTVEDGLPQRRYAAALGWGPSEKSVKAWCRRC